ncbi:hypothetical protein SEA_SIXAMA_10 [Gordonia phage Sixama]|uniref:Uncharacterized protein n=1 Tax=Gordonia phage Sixama TaxID=2653271 RepID=A0A5Q2F0Y8_9CAUD|nr:hypothetical protein PP302_gp010 [Gordonia phage Sixama]QGF20189.1 hypothetical protein SEA_SIXAMA_10 [Gordonia phage Sixama]
MLIESLRRLHRRVFEPSADLDNPDAPPVAVCAECGYYKDVGWPCETAKLIYTEEELLDDKAGDLAEQLLRKWPGFSNLAGQDARNDAWSLARFVVVSLTAKRVNTVRCAWCDQDAQGHALHGDGARYPSCGLGHGIAYTRASDDNEWWKL